MINWIIEGIFRAIYYALIFPLLKLLNASSSVIEILSGKEIFDAIMFNQNNNKIIAMPLFFLIFTIAAVILLVLVFVINIIIAMTKEELQFQERMINAIKNTGKAGIVLIGIPIFFFILNYAIDSFTKMILNLNSHSDDLQKLGNIAWKSGFTGKILKDTKILGWQDRDSQSLLVTAFVTGFMFYCVFITGLAIVKRIFVLFFLYCISPWVAITFPIDNGKRLLVWKDLVIANFLSATAILFSFQIFSIVLPKLLQTELIQKLEAFSRTFIQILLAGGGSIFTLSAQGYINNFIGQGVSLSEGRQMALGLKAIHGGTVAGLGLAKTALGIGKSKLKSFSNNNANGEQPSSLFKSGILTGYRQKGIWGGAAATIGKTGRVISKTSQGLASLVGTTSAIIKNPVKTAKTGWKATKEIVANSATNTKNVITKQKNLTKTALKQKAKQSKQKVKNKINKFEAKQQLQQVLASTPNSKKEGKE